MKNEQHSHFNDPELVKYLDVRENNANVVAGNKNARGLYFNKVRKKRHGTRRAKLWSSETTDFQFLPP